MTKKIFEATIIHPDDMDSIAIKIKYRTIVDETKASLENDFLQMLLSEECADVKLILKDGQLLAHQNILTARTGHFKRLFAAGMKEAKTKEVKIDDHEVNDFRVALEFIYTGAIRSSCDSPQLAAVLTIADKYGMEELLAHGLILLRRLLQSTNRVVEVVDEFFALGVANIRAVCEEVDGSY